MPAARTGDSPSSRTRECRRRVSSPDDDGASRACGTSRRFTFVFRRATNGNVDAARARFSGLHFQRGALSPANRLGIHYLPRPCPRLRLLLRPRLFVFLLPSPLQGGFWPSPPTTPRPYRCRGEPSMWRCRGCEALSLARLLPGRVLSGLSLARFAEPGLRRRGRTFLIDDETDLLSRRGSEARTGTPSSFLDAAVRASRACGTDRQFTFVSNRRPCP